MDFSVFLSTYGEQLISLIAGILTATGITAYISAKVQAWLEKNDRRREIEKIVRDCVELAQRQEPKLTGAEKYEFAAAKAAEWCASVGLQVSEVELEILIERACNTLLKGKEVRTLEEMANEVVENEEANVELADGKGGEEDE